jgi:hypothetical protein
VSCEACEQARLEPKFAHYHWRDADIEVRGCREHLVELFRALNDLQFPDRARQELPGTGGPTHAGH